MATKNVTYSTQQTDTNIISVPNGKQILIESFSVSTDTSVKLEFKTSSDVLVDITGEGSETTLGLFSKGGQDEALSVSCNGNTEISIKYSITPTDSKGQWTLVETKEVTGSAVTDIEFATTIASDVDLGYRIEYIYYNPLVTKNDICLQFDTGTGFANIQSDTLRQTGDRTGRSTTQISGNTSASRVISADATSPAYGEIYMPDMQSGKPFKHGFWARQAGNQGNDVKIVQYSFVLTAPTGSQEITGIKLVSETASGIGVGSIFRLYKLVA